MTEQFTMIILLIALGYFLKRINFIKATDSQVIATLVLNVTLPSLVIVNLNSAELKLSFSILPILMIIYGIVAKMIAVWFFRKYDNHMRGSVGMMTGAMNIGLFAYPLIEVIWPKTGLIYFVMADIGGAFVMFILNISHIHLPHVAIDFFSILSHANMPLSMILLGVMLNFTLERKYIPATIKYLCLHYGLALVAGLLVYVLLPVSDDMIKTTLLVTWMFPVGVAIISYGIQFKYRTLPFIGMTTNLTIIISIIILYVYQAVFV
ncbi:TPA: AEC family transporter [Staphylococcus aureus]